MNIYDIESVTFSMDMHIAGKIEFILNDKVTTLVEKLLVWSELQGTTSHNDRID
jgi:hypothetical protein